MNDKNEQARLDAVQNTMPLDLEGNEIVIPTTPVPEHHPKVTKHRVIITLLIIIFVTMLVVGGLILKSLSKAEKPQTTVVVNTQSLDAGTLNQLTEKADGEVKQQLTITPDTLFKNNVDVQGSVVIRKDLTVDGTLNVQGAFKMNDSLDINKSLRVNGATSLGSDLTVNGKITAVSLSVGSLTISSLNLSGNLNFGGHIIPSGAAPTVRASLAAGGGSINISGNDTAGTVVINMGNAAPRIGELAIITFRTPFGTTPKVQLTAINGESAAIDFFATRNPGFFTISTASMPAAGASYVFDYFVTQ